MTLLGYIFDFFFYGNILLFGYSLYVLFESPKKKRSSLTSHYMNKIYYVIGIATITMFVILSFLVFHIFDGLAWEFVWILILDSVGLFLILLYRNYSVSYNEESITFKSFLNYETTFKWKEIERFSTNDITGITTIINRGKQFFILPYLNNYSVFLNYIKNKKLC